MSTESGRDLVHAADLIARGQLVAFPTETVYGLGAHALDDRAVAGVFAAKERPSFDPLIVHVTGLAAASELVTEFPESARLLADRFWPGPLTLVLPRKPHVPDLVTSGLETVGVRVPDHPVALELLQRADVPIAAPSANLFGQTSPTTAGHVLDQLDGRIDYVLDGGPCRVGIESTVLSFDNGTPVVLRPGGIPLEALTATVGCLRYDKDEPTSAAPQAAPGRLPSHYAPRTPLEVRDASQLPPPDSVTGLLVPQPIDSLSGWAATEVLSPSGDLVECAAGFFAALRRLDAAGLDRLIALPFPDEGLGVALNDRLARASQR